MFCFALLQAAPSQSPQGGNFIQFFGLMAVIFAIFYFLMIRPAKAKQKRHQEMVNLLKNGDRVVVKSPWGQITTEAFVTWHIRQGVTGMGGGFGHIRGLEADPKYPHMGGTRGVGALLPPNVSDIYAGTAPLKLIKVQVNKA